MDRSPAPVQKIELEAGLVLAGSEGGTMRRDELELLLDPLLRAENLELVECAVSGGRRLQQFRISIDRDADPPGVDLETCARVSRQIARILDENPILQGAYSLEVSTPGMNRPVWTRRHFERFAGERVVLELRGGDGLPRHLTGHIGAWDDGGVWIELEPKGREHVQLEAVQRANLRMDPWKKAREARANAAASPAERGRN